MAPSPLPPGASALLVSLLTVTGGLAACGEHQASPPAGPAYTTVRGEAMTTTWEITLPEGPGAREAARAALELFAEVDATMSEWKEGSPLAAVNRAAGERPVAVPEELLELLERSVELARLTDGAFDPTWAALWGLWDFRSDDPEVPDAGEIARRAALVGYRRVELDLEAGTVYLPREGMQLGLGGIAKGWALERAGALLRERGYESFLLVGGGQVLAAGGKEGGAGRRPWRVGIRDPRGARGDFFATLALTDGSASTSGDYESFFVADGVRYHHILDPRTGWPTRGVRSATVVSPEATRADALSTALMALGVERGLPLAERLAGVEAVLVDGEGEIHTTSGLGGRLTVHRLPRRDRGTGRAPLR